MEEMVMVGRRRDLILMACGVALGLLVQEVRYAKTVGRAEAYDAHLVYQKDCITDEGDGRLFDRCLSRILTEKAQSERCIAATTALLREGWTQAGNDHVNRTACQTR